MPGRCKSPTQYILLTQDLRGNIMRVNVWTIPAGITETGRNVTGKHPELQAFWDSYPLDSAPTTYPPRPSGFDPSIVQLAPPAPTYPAAWHELIPSLTGCLLLALLALLIVAYSFHKAERQAQGTWHFVGDPGEPAYQNGWGYPQSPSGADTLGELRWTAPDLTEKD